MIRASGQAWRSRVHQQLDHGRGVLGPVDAAAPEHARQHRLAAEHVQRQVAVVVVVGVELAALLLCRAAARRRRRCRAPAPRAACLVAGDELIDQHAVQRHGLRARGARLQAAQRGRAGQRIDPAHGGLHQHVVAQRVVVVQVFVATAQAVDALGQQVAQAVRDARRIARIAEHRRSRTAQPDALVHPTQQQHAAVRADVAALEVGLDHASPKPPQLHRPIGTLWHRQSSVVIGVKYL